MEIIEAVKEDCELVVALAHKLWPTHEVGCLRQEILGCFDDEEVSFFIVKGGALGFAQVGVRHDYVEGTQSSPVGYLEGIYVIEEARSEGIGRQLVGACEKWSRKKGCHEFASDCELDNQESLAFHLKMGFIEANRIICFTKDC